jgi:hydrogenase maturation protease
LLQEFGELMHSPSDQHLRPHRLIVLGIGNTLMSDDGAGIYVVEALQAQQRAGLLPDGDIEILDGGTLGYLLIDRISDARGIVIVDSANLGAAPGTVRAMAEAEMDRYLNDNPSTSVHEVGLIDLLQMMTLNNEAPRLRALVGIQPEILGWGTEMSPAVAASIPAASRAVKNILAAWVEQEEKCPS